MKYEASEPDSFHRTLDAAMAKGRLVSTWDVLAKALVREGVPEVDAEEITDALFASGAVIDVATLADDHELVERLAFNAAINTIAARSWLRALAAALTEPRP